MYCPKCKKSVITTPSNVKSNGTVYPRTVHMCPDCKTEIPALVYNLKKFKEEFKVELAY